MKKIIKFVFISIIFIFFINISTSSVSAKEYIIDDPHEWRAVIVGEEAKDYIWDKTASEIDMYTLRTKIATIVCDSWWQESYCSTHTIAEFVNEQPDGLAKWIGWNLHIWCWNGLLVHFVFCVPNNNSPIVSADNHNNSARTNDDSQITLSHSTDWWWTKAYAKYSWSNNCASSWTSFINGKKIDKKEWEHTLYLCAKNNAANECSTAQYDTWTKTYRTDTTKPLNADITNNNNTDLLAQVKNYKVTVSRNWWSPITKIDYKYEKENVNNSFISDLDYPSLDFNWLMTEVDNYRAGNGWREYTFKITKICDEAWNCSNLNYKKDHNVYANTLNLWLFDLYGQNSVESWKMADLSWKMADWHHGWIIPELNAILKDTYWNEIIPASWISRTIDFNFNTNHNLNTDQHLNVWNAVYVTEANEDSHIKANFQNTIWLWMNWSTPFDNQGSWDWEYAFHFKVYAPTNITYDLDQHDFIIKNIKIDVNWNIWAKLNILLAGSSNVNFNFKELYTTEFSWEQVDDWILEWATQTWWIIKVLKTPLWENIDHGTWKIKLEKAWVDNNYFNWKASIEGNPYVDFVNNWWVKEFLWNLAIWDKNFSSLFTIDYSWDTIKNIENLYVQSYINYEIDLGKEITYMWDSIWGGTNDANAWLKIYWITNIDEYKQRDITVWQDDDIKNLAGEIDKARLKKDIRSNAYDSIKNVDSNSDWITYWDITYYDFSLKSNKILNLSTYDLNSTSNTIIIKWWNLYITWDSTDWSNLPWIIILKDNNWNWGKLYIDPEVSRIDAIIYTDKSILSYNVENGSSIYPCVEWEISPDCGWTAELLQKQLYIHGSVFSENTIWGSRLEYPICPFYLGYPDNICSLDEAQKYDLNYLRRWIVSQQPWKWDYPVIIEYNSKLQLNPPALFSN